jgi:hypothetical protein
MGVVPRLIAMPLKSIISIDVDDAKFANFKAQFDKYHAALGKQSEMWAKAGKSQTQIANHWQQLTAKMMAQQNSKKGDIGDADKKQLTNLRQSDSLWTSMQRNTKDVAKNIAGATTSLLRWTGLLSVVSGLFGAGGLYGINRMAAGVSDRRQSAMGRGLSIGQQSAFTTNFARIFGGNADPFLSNVNEMMSDPSKSWSLATLGVNNTGKTEDVAVNLLKAMRQRAKGTSDNMLGLLDKQTGVGAGTQVWRTLHDMSDKEFEGQLANNQRDVKALGVGDNTAKAWQDFTDQMHRAGQAVENEFTNGLVKLAGPLKDLSGAFVTLVRDIIGSEGMKEGINTLAGWIREFAQTIETGEFQKSVTDFVDRVGELAKSLKPWAHPVDALMDSAPRPLKALYDWQKFKGTKYEGMDEGVFGGPTFVPNGGKKWFSPIHLKTQDAAIGLPEGTIRSLSGYDPEMFGGGGNAGEMRRDSIQRYIEGLEHRYRNWTDTDDTPSIQKALAAYSMGQKQFDSVLAAHPTDWQKNISPDAQRLVLTIQNNTGGNVVTVLNAQ